MLLIPLQPQQLMNPCSHQAFFRPKCSYSLCNTIGNALRSEGIGVELLQIDTFLSQKLPFYSIITRVKMVAYSDLF